MALQFQALCSVSAAAVAGLLLLSVGSGGARSEPGPFSALSGSWSGGGMIKKANGAGERIRCRSAIETAGGSNLSLRLRCASGSYNFDLTANIAYHDGTLSRSFQQTTPTLITPIS